MPRLAICNGFDTRSEYADSRDRFNISAPQVAQIASEHTVAVLPWLCIALAVTSLTIIVGVALLRSRTSD